MPLSSVSMMHTLCPSSFSDFLSYQIDWHCFTMLAFKQPLLYLIMAVSSDIEFYYCIIKIVLLFLLIFCSAQFIN